MTTIGIALLLAPVLLALYAYVIYPALLMLLASDEPAPHVLPDSENEYPSVSISLPVYNEASQIREVIASLLRLDYPRDKLQILVISDASTDSTDSVVREYADQGVELLRQPLRLGKTAGETAGAAHLRGDIVVNTDASIRIAPGALKRIVAPFSDPRIGLVSGRDISVSREAGASVAESGYVGYEMYVRKLETRAGGIIGASGCFYAIRRHLHQTPLPDALSRDFASALITREHGLRAASADDAICYVPRTQSARREYSRKVRTIMRGMETLAHKKHLLSPRQGAFAWKLFSHKICRWAVPWAALGGAAGIALLAAGSPIVAGVAASLGAGASAAAVATWVRDGKRLPLAPGLIGSALLANLAVIHATIGAAKGGRAPTWEPTRRETVLSSDPA